MILACSYVRNVTEGKRERGPHCGSTLVHTVDSTGDFRVLVCPKICQTALVCAVRAMERCCHCLCRRLLPSRQTFLNISTKGNRKYSSQSSMFFYNVYGIDVRQTNCNIAHLMLTCRCPAIIDNAHAGVSRDR